MSQEPNLETEHASASDRPTTGQLAATLRDLDDDKLRAIAARLDALPPRQELTIAAAIGRLAPQIKKLQARGYTLAVIAAELTASGVQIAPRTLARYLASAAPASRRRRAKA